ncbi:MAG: hypothetical protein WC635_11135 [Bacteriovorax sp.]|jgi:hypothetical protein
MRLLQPILLLLLATCLPIQASDKLPVEDIIPVTMGNLRGHKILYNEGWYVVTSSKKALAYAYDQSITSSGEDISKMKAHLGNRISEFKKSINENTKSSIKTGKSYYQEGKKSSKDMREDAHDITRAEMAKSKELFIKAWDRFTLGYIHLGERTKADREELQKLNGGYFSSLKNDFSNFDDWLSSQGLALSSKAEFSWKKSFSKGQDEFNREYEKSGKESNSLLALPHLIWGYMKAAYYSVVKPTADSTEAAVTTVGKTLAKGIAYTLGSVAIVSGRTVYSLGANFFYIGKAAILVFSPTYEGGFLASAALLSAASVPVTYVAGETFGVVTQVAVTSTAPLVGTGKFVLASIEDTATQAALLTYDTLKGTSEVVLNQGKAAVVLGYNALTAIPTQTAMAAGNALIFLSWDGPRLALYSLKGDVAFSNKFPAGLVLNRKKLEESKTFKVEKISEDPKVIQDVLSKMPQDIRGKNHD